MNIQAPLRLAVLKKITGVLKGITPANGYQFDLSDNAASGTQRVKRGVLFIGDDDPDILVTLLEPPVAIEQMHAAPDNQNRSNEWDIIIQGWARDDKDNEPCDLAYALGADVQKAIALELKNTQTGRPGSPNLLGLGRAISRIRIGAPVTRPTEEVSGYGVFYLILTLEIVEDMANPFGYLANQPNGE